MDLYELAAAAMGSPTYVPIGADGLTTPAQEKAIKASAAVMRGKRRFARYVMINDRRNAKSLAEKHFSYDAATGKSEHVKVEGEREEVNCRDCDHCRAHNSEHQLGWCGQLRFRISTWHPVLCNGFKAAT
jgi:hypothetical protein